jgi:39S ribosomal protein L53/MRP-L53
MVLKHLSKVVVQFSPFTGNSRSAREFLARVTAPKAQASNPDCVVDGRIRKQGWAAHSCYPCHLRICIVSWDTEMLKHDTVDARISLLPACL